MRTLRKTVRLHRTQYEFCHSTARYRAFIGGRGSGKSWVACYDLIRRTRRGGAYLVTAPTYPMLFDSEFRTFTRLARELGVLAGVKVSPPHARLTTGAEILFRSADDPDRLRGSNLSGAVLMEAALTRREVYDVVIACLRESADGWLSASTTPRGPTHWTHEVFATGRPDTALFRAPTRANPFLPPDFEATLRRQFGDTQWARQELGGEFVSIEGAWFPAAWFDTLFVDELPGDIVYRVVALDPSTGGSETSDYQAYVLAALRRNGDIYLDADIDRRSPTEMVRQGIDLCRHWGPVDSLLVESNATMGFIGPEVERASRETGVLLPWQLVHQTANKYDRIRGLSGYLSRGQIKVLNTPGGRKLVAQLRDAPLGEYDDGPDSASTAVRHLERLTQGV